MKNIIIFCLLLSHNILFAQYEPPIKLDIDFDIGVMAELGFLYLEKSTDITPQTSSSVRIVETKNTTTDSPLSLYLSGRLNFTDYIALEVRPGIVLGDGGYIGLELGLLLRYKFWKEKMFLAGGVNFHFNSGNAHGAFSASNETFTLYGLNLGINMSNSFAFIVSYYFLSQKEFLYGEYNWESYNTDRYMLKNVLKLGFDFTF